MPKRRLFLDINGFSKHINSPAAEQGLEYNEENPGFGLTAESVSDNGFVKGLTGGGYKNSYGDNSFYGGGTLAKRFGDKYYADVGGFAGLVSGYGDIKRQFMDDRGQLKELNTDYKDINPMAGIMVNLGKKDAARLGIKYMPGKPNLFMMNLGIPIK